MHALHGHCTLAGVVCRAAYMHWVTRAMPMREVQAPAVGGAPTGQHGQDVVQGQHAGQGGDGPQAQGVGCFCLGLCHSGEVYPGRRRTACWPVRISRHQPACLAPVAVTERRCLCALLAVLAASGRAAKPHVGMTLSGPDITAWLAVCPVQSSLQTELYSCRECGGTAGRKAPAGLPLSTAGTLTRRAAPEVVHGLQVLARHKLQLGAWAWDGHPLIALQHLLSRALLVSELAPVAVQLRAAEASPARHPALRRCQATRHMPRSQCSLQPAPDVAE